MKTLVLTCSTGGGHNACAEAIRRTFAEKGDVCDVEGALQFESGRLSDILSRGHVTMYRHIPGLFRRGYGFAERHPGILNEDAAAYKLLTAGTEELHRFLAQGGYDTVICTHIFAGLLLSRTLREYPMEIRTAFIATDYTCSPGAADTRPDFCFIPAAALISEFVRQGVPAERIVASGIPVRKEFYLRGNKAEAKALLGIDPSRPHLLVMCGSMGCGPLKKLAELLSRRIGSRCDITIVCGTNESLRKTLEKRYRDCPHIHIRGFAEDMPGLMDSADLYLTKPGGLSTSEAAAKGLPMVLMDTVGGCEENNLRYFTALGGAVTASTVWELTELCARILEDEAQRTRMEEALVSHGQGDAAQCVWLSLHGGERI